MRPHHTISIIQRQIRILLPHVHIIPYSCSNDVGARLWGHVVQVAVVVWDADEVGWTWTSIILLRLSTLNNQTGGGLHILYGEWFREEVVRRVNVVLSLNIASTICFIVKSFLRDHIRSFLGSLIRSESLFGRVSYASVSAISKVLMTLIPNLISWRRLVLSASHILITWHLSFYSFQIFIDIVWFVRCAY